MSRRKLIKKCIIKGCQSTSEKDSEKIFVKVPDVKTRRLQWFTIARIPITTTTSYCCEDHFDLTEDAENWSFWSLAGTKLRMKPGVVPHKRLNMPSSSPPRLASQMSESSKRRKREFLEAFESEGKRTSDFTEISEQEEQHLCPISDVDSKTESLPTPRQRSRR